MARPFKSGVDYFPLDVVLDDKVKILEAEHGITGFGVWVKLHQKVYSNNYWIDWDKKAKIIFSNEVNVDINQVNDVINSCLEWDIFSKKIFEQYSVLTSRGIQKRYFKICEKRLRVEIVKEYTLIDVPIIDRQEIVIVDINSVNSVNSTQSKVKESKSKEILTRNFDSFWSAYPKKKSKGQAEKAFQKIKPDDTMLEKILYSISIQKESHDWLKESGKYIPYPATWLNAKGWEDEEPQQSNPMSV